MRLIPSEPQDRVTIGDATFQAGKDGSFDVPDEVGQQLNLIHVDGRKLFETDAERIDRLSAAELKRRRDPATIVEAIEKLGGFDTTPPENKTTGDEDPATLRSEAETLRERAAWLDAQADRLDAE